LGLNLKACVVVLDHTVMKGHGLATGANIDGWHYTGFSVERDLLPGLAEHERAAVIIGDIAQARHGDLCPECNEGILTETRGIEIGNIFHLGTKYSKSMGWTYLDESGAPQNPVMGCYGIGITRLLPAIIEESYDERGPIFPLPISPFEVHLCALNFNTPEVAQVAEALYKDLLQAGCEVVFDDRDEKAGSQFADADLLGVPFRLVVSPRSLEKGGVEFVYRDKSKDAGIVSTHAVVARVQGEIQAAYQMYNNP
jgi:prolyl-tRNA synthetase